ncbi:PHP domain-containing protein, partial [Flagellimonas sp.]|uniref:PHP domain-containing protein n=1 Tax=Flagellimonas sp. TaxID=2058762 RepID=UPI003AB890CC
MYLNCHTYYSLNYGVLSETELLELACSHGVETLALTDINSSSAGMNFVRLTNEQGIRPILGIDFRNGNVQEFVGLAQNNEGFQEINAFLSQHLHKGTPIPTVAPPFAHVHVIYPFEKIQEEERTDFKAYEYIGVSVDELRKLRFSRYREFKDRLVLLQPVSFRSKKDFNTHRLLRAIGLNTLLSKLPQSEEARPTDTLRPMEELKRALADVPHIWENTQRLMDSCTIAFGFGSERVSQNQSRFLASKAMDVERLRELALDGLTRRYAYPTEKVRERMFRELRTIQELDFVSYFLINHDIVSYAKSKGYPYVGRGSGANSLVAYLIGITDVDPIELDLYFERFINPFRASPPDFDIDFSTWVDRAVNVYHLRRMKVSSANQVHEID